MSLAVDFAQFTTRDALAHLKSSSDGLTSREAVDRQRTHGLNRLSSRHHWRWLRVLAEPFMSAFVIVLIIGGAFSWLIGHKNDTVIIAVVVALNALIDWGQQFSANRTLKSLRNYTAQKAKVRRAGKVIQIGAEQLVPGDVVLISEGDKIPADGRLLDSYDLSIDEAVLTGESQPVTKRTTALKARLPIFKQANMVFSGTVCAGGRGVYCVSATGNQSAFGKIAALAEARSPQPPIYRKIRSLTLYLMISAFTVAAGVIALGLARGNSFEEILRFAIALLVSVIPEGLPVSLTVIFLVGVRQMARSSALVRNLTAVETLGMVTAVATDKTGTLTHARLELGEFWTLDNKLSPSDHTQLWLSVSHRHPDLYHPIERLISEYTATRKAPHEWVEVDDLPFNTGRRATWVLWRRGRSYRLYLKGAPEVMLEHLQASPTDLTKIKGRLNKLTRAGMRVVAITYQPLRRRPHRLSDLKPRRLKFVGLVGFREQLRAGAKESIAATQQAGITVYMLTGDHLKTARAIGTQLGINKPGDPAVEGQAFTRLSPTKLRRLLKQTRVFGRVLPEHKYQLLESLRTSQITAMTGDGVNDVPALTKADIGIAMGSGSDAAKEAADIVLLDDNYSTIVRAISAGRTIYANIRKLIYFQLSTNLAEALAVIGSLLLGLPLPLTAAQILWVNLVTDTSMIIPLGLEKAERRQMLEPPRPPQEPLLSNHLISRLILNGLIMAAGTLLSFVWFKGEGLATGQTVAFLTLCVVQWAAAFNARSETTYSWQLLRRPNPYLLSGILISALLVALAIVGPLAPYVGTTAISWRHLLILLPVVIVVTLASDLHKWWTRRFA